MSTLDEITKEKQRVGEALARVDAQREKLTGQLGELEAAERVLARYGTGTRATKKALAKTPATATKAAAPVRSRGRPRTIAARPAGGKRTSPIRSLPWQMARRSRKSLPHARGLAQTMSAWRLPGTSGLAALKNATGSSTLRSRWRRCNPPRSDTGIAQSTGLTPKEAAGRLE